jgi:hypothetical protein
LGYQSRHTGGIRTPIPLIWRERLSQLSYRCVRTNGDRDGGSRTRAFGMAHRRRDRLTTSRSGTSRSRTCKGCETPPDLQSGALPFGHGSPATRTGVEPVAFWSTARHANRYTYGPPGGRRELHPFLPCHRRVLYCVSDAHRNGSGGIRTPKAPKRPDFTDRCDSPSSPRSQETVRVGLEPTRPAKGGRFSGPLPPLPSYPDRYQNAPLRA